MSWNLDHCIFLILFAFLLLVYIVSAAGTVTALILIYENLELVHNAFRKKDWSVRYHINITRGKGYFIDDMNNGGDNICKMTEFLIGKIFGQFGECIFCLVIIIQMGVNSIPLLADFSFTHMRTNFQAI